MSFDAREVSAFDGEPQELYWFLRGTDSWLYTSGAYPITLDLQTYEPLAGLSRSNIKLGRERARNQLTVEMPKSAGLATEFITVPSQTPVWLYLYGIHESETDFRIIWQGRVSSVDFKGEKATLTLDDVMATTKKQAFRAFYQNQCNNFMFDANCTLSEDDFREDGLVILSVDGDVITFDNAQAAGFFISGQIRRENGDRRMVVNDTKASLTHTVTLLQPFEDMEVGEVVRGIGGACRHTFDTCFSGNQENFGGYPLVPRKDPFKSFV